MSNPSDFNLGGLSRRRLLQGATAAGLLAALEGIAPAYAWPRGGSVTAARRVSGDVDIFDLEIGRTRLDIGGRDVGAITMNGSLPAPLIRLREGRDAVIRVTNRLDEDTSIHWHGVLLPYEMDGVPGVSFPGIRPGETFEYRYPVRQAGTYWYHSHSGLQEQVGHYGPLVIDPAGPEPFAFDRDYVIMLSDWTYSDPHWVLSRLKKAEGYFNYQQRTVAEFFRDVEEKGWARTWRERGMWGRMRMTPRDILDVTGAEYIYLINGLASESNWTGLFRTGEKVRLRFINGSAMTFFDVRIPGLKMSVVQADGQNIEPVAVDEFRIGTAETYDVIVEPRDDRAYTVFAESMDRSGFVRGTLAPREGMSAPVPDPRPRPVERGMAAMGGHGMDMSDAGGKGMAMDHRTMNATGGGTAHTAAHGDGRAWVLAGRAVDHGPDDHGPGAAMVAEHPRNRMGDPGVGLHSSADHKVLVYDDLRSLAPWPDQREPGREIELHLTGNMERYMWSFDGRKFSEVEGPIRFHHGERLRLILVNDTMMEHPIHLHGMWMELENRHGTYRPRKHTLSLKPGEMLSARITADAPGDWAFHCHLLYHMKAGMFRVVSVV